MLLFSCHHAYGDYPSPLERTELFKILVIVFVTFMIQPHFPGLKLFYFKLFFFPIAICPALLVRQQFHGRKPSTGGNRIYVTIYIEFPSCRTSCHIGMNLGLQHPCEVETYRFPFIIDWKTKTLCNKASVDHRAKSRSQLSPKWTCVGYCKTIFLPSRWCYFSDKKGQKC